MNNRTSITQYATDLSDYYINNSTKLHRKERGQYFTPDEVAHFMVKLTEKKPYRILDPGAGTGILSLALIEKLCSRQNGKKIHIDLYEKDKKVIPLLEKTIKFAKRKYPNFTYKIYPLDFDKEIISKRDNIFENKIQKYDLIIANPPYFKISSKSSLVKSAKLYGIHGSTNIYTLIMALSKELLDDDGEMIFIVPRSFCNGLYFKYFRQFMLRELSLDYIHIFSSRKDTFSKDNVLQENIIVKLSKKPQVKKIKISSSSSLSELYYIRHNLVDMEKIIDLKSGHYMIRIPVSSDEEEIIDIVQAWPENLYRLNMEISTGPIVAYRSNLWLTKEHRDYPLIMLNNVNIMQIEWPIKNFKKPQYVKHCNESVKWLVPNSNYILLRRFSAKEDKQRLIAAPLLENKFKSTFIGIENHVNFIHRPVGHLTENEIYGMATLLNSKILNKYFQIMNGHTQVNATELRLLPLPRKDVVMRIGNYARKTNDYKNAVLKVLHDYYSEQEKGVLVHV